MLSVHQVEKIVRDCLIKLTGVVEKINAGRRLKSFGIEGGARLGRFKALIANEVSRYEHRITTSDLDFDQDVIVARIYSVIISGATPLVSARSVAKGKAKAAKQNGAKKKSATKKSKARSRSAGGGWGGSSYGGGKRAAVSGPPPPDRGKRKRAPKKAKKAPVSKKHARPREDEAELSLEDALVGDNDLAIAEEVAAYKGLPGDPTPLPRGPGAGPPRLRSDDPKPTSPPPAAKAGAKAEPEQQPTRTVECTPQLEIRNELVPSEAY